MNPMIRLLLAVTLILSWLHPAAAQEVEPSDMVRGGMQVIEMIDQGRAGELWDGATPATRKRVTRADFIGQVARNRAQIGVPQMRTWVSVNRQVVTASDGDAAGQYVSVEYETRFANRPDTTLRELVSFHLDTDRVWRFSGYVLK